MKEAHINEASLGIFAWARLEPEEGRYDLDWLGKIIDRLYENGIYTILATPTGALPHWMSEKYEEVRQTLSNGMRKYPGMRHNFCPSSPVMRKKARAIDEALSRRFGTHPGVIAWHIYVPGRLRGTREKFCGCRRNLCDNVLERGGRYKRPLLYRPASPFRRAGNPHGGDRGFSGICEESDFLQRKEV